MTQRLRTYLGIGGIFALSAILLIQFRDDSIMRLIAGIPFAGSLVSALLQFLRDQVAYERSLLMQDANHRFVLGVSSHMANVAFDKHVEFSEAYLTEAQAALITLFQYGPSEEVAKHAGALFEVRKRYVVWLTASVEDSLDPFEAALRRIAADAWYIKAISGEPQESKARQNAVTSMYNTLARVLGFKEWDGAMLTDELAITGLVRNLRGLLGTAELTQMRSLLVAKAADGLRSKG